MRYEKKKIHTPRIEIRACVLSNATILMDINETDTRANRTMYMYVDTSIWKATQVLIVPHQFLRVGPKHWLCWY